METGVAPPPTAPEPSRPPRPLGGLLDLAFFFFSAILIFLFVQFAAVSLVFQRAAEKHPGLTTREVYRRLAEDLQYDAFFLVPVQVTIDCLLVLLLYALVSGRRRLPFWSTLHVLRLEPRERTAQLVAVWLLAGFVLALSVGAASVLVPPPEQLPINKLFSSRAAFWLIFATAVVVAPFAEELIFRGYLYALLEGLWGRTAAVVASGIAFGSIHIPQLSTGDFAFNAIFPVLLIFIVGFAFSLVRARSGTVVASVLCHAAYNFTISIGFLFSDQYGKLACLF